MKKVVHAVVILVVAWLAVRQIGKNVRNSRQAKAEAVPEAWIQTPPAQWPQIVLTHDAAFAGHGELKGASAFLAKLPDGRVVAVTAKHLFGFQSDLPKLTVSRLDGALQSWKLHARTRPEPFVRVKGLLGDPGRYGTFDDVVALKLETGGGTTPFHALTVRQSPVKRDEPVFVIGVPYGSDSTQEVYAARIIANADNILDGVVEGKVAMEGFSGAPVVDRTGRVVGVLTGPAGLYNPEKERGFSAHTVLELEDVLASVPKGP